MDLPDDLDEFLRQKESEDLSSGGKQTSSSDTTSSGGPLTTSNISGDADSPSSSKALSEDVNTLSTNSEILDKLARKFEQESQEKTRKQPAFWLKPAVASPSKEPPLSLHSQVSTGNAPVIADSTAYPGGKTALTAAQLQSPQRPFPSIPPSSELKAALNDIPTADQSFASSNLQDLSLSLNDTDDEKDEFFKRIAKQTGGDADYAQLNRNLADDSVDMGELPVKLKISELAAATKPAASTSADISSISMIQQSAGAQEDWDSIQSNIDFIESSHVFSESDISFDIGTSQSRRVSTTKSQEPSAQAQPKKEAEKSATKVKVESSKQLRPGKPKSSSFSSSTSSLSRGGSGGGSRKSLTVKAGSVTKLSSPSTQSKLRNQEVSNKAEQPAQLLRELQFLQGLLDKEQDQSRDMRRRLEDLEKENTRLTSENNIMSAELLDLKSSSVRLTLPRKDEATEVSQDGNRAMMEQQDRLIEGYQVENERLVAQLRDQKSAFKQAEQEWEAERQRFKDQLSEMNTRVVEFDGRSSRQSRRQEDDHLQQLERFRLTVKEREAELNTRILELESEVKKMKDAAAMAVDPSSVETEEQLSELRQAAELQAVEAREREGELSMRIGELETELRRSESARRSELPQTAQQLEEALEQAQLRHRQRESELNTRVIELESTLRKWQKEQQWQKTATGTQAEPVVANLGTQADINDTQMLSPISPPVSGKQESTATQAGQAVQQETIGTQVDQIREDLERKLVKVRSEYEQTEKRLRTDLTQLRVAGREKDTLIDQLRRQLEHAKSVTVSSSGTGGLSLRSSLKKKNRQQPQTASKAASTESVQTKEKSSLAAIQVEGVQSAATSPAVDVEHETKLMTEKYESEIRQLNAELLEERSRLANVVTSTTTSATTTSGIPQPEGSDSVIRLALAQVVTELREELSRHKKDNGEQLMETERMRNQLHLAQNESRELSNRIKQLESTNAALQSELQHLQSRDNEEMAEMQRELRSTQSSLSQTQQKLITSETVRQTLHEQFKQLLKQAQETTVETALAHHDQTIARVRQESQQWAESEAQTAVASLQHQLSTKDTLITALREQVDTLSIDLQQHRDRVSRLERQLNDDESRDEAGKARERQLVKETALLREELDKTMAECRRLERELGHLRQSLSPSAVQYHQLWTQLETLDERLRQRESNWERLLRESERSLSPTVAAQAAVDKVRGEYEKQLQLKDQQLLSFRQQLDGLVKELVRMQRKKSPPTAAGASIINTNIL